MPDVKKLKSSITNSTLKNVLTEVVADIIEPSDIIIDGVTSSSRPDWLKTNKEIEDQKKIDALIAEKRTELIDKVVEVIGTTIRDKKEMLKQERTGRVFKDQHPIAIEIAQNLMKSKSIADEIRKKAKTRAADITDETITIKLAEKVDSALNKEVLKKIKEAVDMEPPSDGASKASMPADLVVNAKLRPLDIKLTNDKSEIVAPTANLVATKTDSTGSKTFLG